MRPNTLVETNKKETFYPEIMLKVTALQYFTEALYKEKYEDCKALIGLATKYGAQKREVKNIIDEYVKWLNGMRGLDAILYPQKGFRL